MESKIKDYINSKIKTDNKRVKLLVFIGILAVVLIMMSSFFDGKESRKPDQNATQQLSYSQYTKELEKSLTNIISSIDGVGNCKVMITLENTAESVYAVNSDRKTDSGQKNEREEYVLMDSSSGDQPVLIKEYMPKVQGVSVVCSGGNSIEVKESIIGAVTSLFNISSNRVSVSKINE